MRTKLVKMITSAQFRASAALLCLLIYSLRLPCSRAADPDLPAGAKVLRDLPYVTKGHPRQKLDLYLPALPKGPLLIYIHGGGWQTDTKDHVEGLALLTQGYAVASLDYRFSSDAVFPAQIEDCKAGIRWLRAHARDYGYDSKRFGAWGSSAGGHLTALLAATGATREFDVGEQLEQSSAIQCGIDLFGPADLPGFQPPNADPKIQRDGSESIFVHLLGGSIDQKRELAKKASPLAWVSKDCAPLYIMHGTADPLIPLEQSQRLATELKAAGVEVTLDVVSGGGHGGPQFWSEGRPQHLIDFLNRHLLAP